MVEYKEPRMVTHKLYEPPRPVVNVRVTGCWLAVTGADDAAIRREVLRQFISRVPLPCKLTPSALHEACSNAKVRERVRRCDAREFEIGPDVDGIPLDEFARGN